MNKFIHKKRFGQHFINNISIIENICSYAQSGSSIIEIGPGIGALTKVLTKKDVTVFAIEIDRNCEEYLQNIGANILMTDAMQYPFWTLGTRPRLVISNLPYNIATPLLIKMAHNASSFDGMRLMFQKEVADRIIANNSDSSYGRLSVISQACFIIEKVFDLNPCDFTPPPKVASTVLDFSPNPAWDSKIISTLEHITQAAFMHRRKMIKANLSRYLIYLDDLKIPHTVRPQEIDVSQYIKLASRVHYDAVEIK